MPAPPGPGGWTVTNQTEVTKPDPSGNFTAGVQVYFTTALGQSGSVFVPDSVYPNVDQVRAMIAARAAIVDQVRQLSDPGTGQ